MREILFRGKQDGGDWVCGLPYEVNEKYTSICKIAPYPIRGGWFVLSATLGQFTGLTDKNGKKIFKGDICKDSLGKIFAVEYDNQNARFIGFYKDRHICYIGREPKAEIIGNIYDNPELLEVKE